LFEVWLHDAIDSPGTLEVKLSGLPSSREIIRAAGLISRGGGDDNYLHSALLRLPDPVTM
jgi:hypothetical protein